MGAHVEKKLKALDIRRLTKPGRHADGGGLYLTITKSGSRSRGLPPSNHTSFYEIGWLMKEVIDATQEAFSGGDHQQAARG